MFVLVAQGHSGLKQEQAKHLALFSSHIKTVILVRFHTVALLCVSSYVGLAVGRMMVVPLMKLIMHMLRSTD
jgi:hypothetical protein